MACRLAGLRQRSSLFTLAKMPTVFALICLCGCSASKPHEVQEAQGAIVVTVVSDPWGLVPGADVHVQDAAGAVKRVGRTNSCGVVAFEPLPDGTYSVRTDGE